MPLLPTTFIATRKLFLLALSLLALFLIITVITNPVKSAGDWIVTGSEVVENQSRDLAGNLIVKNGGSLTLKNVTLTMQSQYDGQYRIEVEPGGELFIESGSIITASNSSHHYDFAVRGSALEIKNSEVHGAGRWIYQELNNSSSIFNGSRGLLVDTDNALLDGNTFSGNNVGVILTGSGITLTNNTIYSNTAHGIYIQGGTNNLVSYNTIRHGGDVSSPVRLNNSDDNTISHNNIESNILRGIIETLASDNNLFDSNNISGHGMGTLLMYVSNNNTISNNTYSVDEAGIMIWGTGNIVSGNTINDTVKQAKTGIYMVYAYNSRITDNKFYNIGNEHGIFMRNSSNNLISGNTATADTDFFARFSSGLMMFSKCKNNVLYGNSFTNFQRGATLFYASDNNTIASNTFSTSSQESFVVDDSSENVIYRNNFINNTLAAYDNADNNWDHEGYGNYWSEYTGSDVNSDGIGDTPYNVSPNGSDNYPLMTSTSIDSLTLSDPQVITPTSLSPIESQYIESGDNVTISNQTINLGFYHIRNGGSLTLDNVTLITGGDPRASSGIHLDSGGSLTINNSTITHTEYGAGFDLFAKSNSNLVIADSELSVCGSEWWYGGIQIATDNFSLENNTFSDTMLFVKNVNGGSIINNTILRNYQALDFTISNATISGNTIISGVRTPVKGSGSGNTIKNNTISGTWENGIHLHNNSDTLIENNYISGIRQGYRAIIVDANNTTVKGNTISDVYTGIRLAGSGPFTVSNNSITGSQTAMNLGSNNGSISYNTISSCGLGISLEGFELTLTHNTISNCSKGIYIPLTDKIFTIYNNNFIGNDSQAEDNGINTNWDNGSRGNYWSDYTGSDNNHDGIGDTPYNILPGGTDHYPLMAVTFDLVEKLYLPLVINSSN